MNLHLAGLSMIVGAFLGFWGGSLLSLSVKEGDVYLACKERGWYVFSVYEDGEYAAGITCEGYNASEVPEGTGEDPWALARWDEVNALVMEGWAQACPFIAEDTKEKYDLTECGYAGYDS